MEQKGIIMDNIKCHICRKELKKIESSGENYYVECDYCGKYFINRYALNYPIGVPEKDSHFVMCAIRNLSEQGEIITFSENTVKNLHERIIPPANPVETVDKILEYIANSTKGKPGLDYEFSLSNDFPIFFAESDRELLYHINNAESLGYIKKQATRGSCTARLTLDGWRRLEEIKNTRRQSKQAFVAMWFDEALTSAWDNGIADALKKTGYVPLRIDKKEHNNKICDEIIAEIRKSGLVIADFTGHRGGVYFEAGYAMGLNIPVIWTCRKNDIEKAHFDTRQYSHIVWETPDDLSKKLVHRIEATLPLIVKK
jgi:nucleoside 2-deoxyribosyltransferase/DNA-directed RNA polymerase subunit RPC12/RpoP